MSIAGTLDSDSIDADALVIPIPERTRAVQPPRAAAVTKPRETALTVAGARNEVIDVVRLFAAAGIVFIHAVESDVLVKWSNMARFAVPFYLFASLYFQSISLRRNADRSLLQFVAGRVKRLYLPFLAWTAIYLLVRDIKRIAVLRTAVDLRPSLLWQGSEYHLWFLPFLLMVSIVFAAAQRTFVAIDRRLRWVGIAIAIAAGIAVAFTTMPNWWIDKFDQPTYAYVQWWRSLPAAFWAMAFAWLMTLGSTVLAVGPIVGFAGIGLALACLYRQVIYDTLLVPRGLSGLGCMLGALMPWRGPAVSAMARLGRYGYGVYLCHVLFVQTIHNIAWRMHFSASVTLDLVVFTFSFAGSLALVKVLACSKRLSWLNG